MYAAEKGAGTKTDSFRIRKTRFVESNYLANRRRNIAADLIVSLVEHAGRPSNKDCL
jgi:hypothetical protein